MVGPKRAGRPVYSAFLQMGVFGGERGVTAWAGCAGAGCGGGLVYAPSRDRPQIQGSITSRFRKVVITGGRPRATWPWTKARSRHRQQAV